MNKKIVKRYPNGITYTKYEDGIQEWRQNELLHREDGPAIIYPNGVSHYFIKGIPYPKAKFLVLTCKDIPEENKSQVLDILDI